MASELGRVSKTRRETATFAPQVAPDSFGEGIGQALRGLGQAVNEYESSAITLAASEQGLSQAYVNRQRAVADAETRANFIRLRAEFARNESDIAAELPPGAPGYTDEVARRSRETFGSFLDGLDERVRKDYEAEVETAVQTNINSAFQYQTAEEGAQYGRTVSSVTERAINGILDTSTPMAELDGFVDTWRQEIDKLLLNSPLGGGVTQDLADEIDEQISRAVLARKAQEEALGNAATSQTGQIEMRGDAVYSANPVAAGLPGIAIGLLNAIATPESAGEYNRMFSGEGKRYFSDFSDHPNDPTYINYGEHEGRMSSAAGRYQFINGTWRRIADAHGLEDFSPANQDRGAWLLAQEDYRARTGKDLQVILASGNQAQIEEARRVLSATWEGLKNVKPEDFYNSVTRGLPNVSAYTNDPEFANIPYGDRLAIVNGAQAQAQNLMADIQTRQDQQSTQAYNEMLRAITDGNPGIGPAEIRQMSLDNGWTFDQENKAVNQWEDRNKSNLEAAGNLGSLINGGTLPQGTTETKNSLNNIYNLTGMNREMNNLNADYFDSVVMPTVRGSQTISPVLEAQLGVMMSSSDARKADFAYTQMAKLIAEAPIAAQAAFSEPQIIAATAYRSLAAAMPQSEALSRIQIYTDPAMATQRNLAEQAFDREVTNGNFQVAPQQVANKIFSNNLFMSPGTGQQLSAEYTSVARMMYAMTGNLRESQKGAEEIIKQRWGEYEINGIGQVMKYPPSQTHPQFNQSHDYIEQQFFADFPNAPEVGGNLVSDHVTWTQAAAGEPASYVGIKTDEYGNAVPMTYRDTQEYEMLRNSIGPAAEAMADQIVRFTPRITEQMQQQLAAEMAVQNDIELELEALDGRLQQAEMAGDTAQVGALLEERAALTEAVKGLTISDPLQAAHQDFTTRLQEVNRNLEGGDPAPDYGQALARAAIVRGAKGFVEAVNIATDPVAMDRAVVNLMEYLQGPNGQTPAGQDAYRLLSALRGAAASPETLEARPSPTFENLPASVQRQVLGVEFSRIQEAFESFFRQDLELDSTFFEDPEAAIATMKTQLQALSRTDVNLGPGRLKRERQDRLLQRVEQLIQRLNEVTSVEGPR